MIQPVPAPSIVLRVRRWRKQSLNVSLSREADKWSCPPLRQAAFLGISATRGLVNGFGKYSPLVVARHDTVLGKKILGCHCRRLSQVFKWNNTHQQSFVVCACGKGADYIIIQYYGDRRSRFNSRSDAATTPKDPSSRIFVDCCSILVLSWARWQV